MRQDAVAGREGRGRIPFPWFGAAFSALMSLLMLVCVGPSIRFSGRREV